MRIALYLGLATALGFSACKKDIDNRPNILFIMSDDHTSQAWGIYGGILDSLISNPNIRRLAEEGSVLNNAFCTNSICVPSRASILTGQYSHENKVYTLADELSSDHPNIAKELREHGYQTAVVGKWHLKSKPAGFDYFLVLPGQGLYRNPILKNEETWAEGREGGTHYKGFSSDVIAEESLKWLDKRDKEKPFFLMTHFKATHEPFDYPDRLEDLYEYTIFPEPASLLEFSPDLSGRTVEGQQLEILGQRWIDNSTLSAEQRRYPGLPFSLEGLDSVSARKKIYQKFIRDFLRCGSTIDENIGKLLEYLDDNDLAENTIVIYTADQGYFLGEHGFFDKRMIYEEAIRMPFVIRYPPEVKASQRVDEIILNIDFPALFADYAGLPELPFIRGKSFRHLLTGGIDPSWRKSMYYRYWLHRKERPAHFGIRTDRYKLAFFYGNPLDMNGAIAAPTTPGWEFYDLLADPGENKNQYKVSQYSGIIDTLKRELKQLREQWQDADVQDPTMMEIISSAWN